MFSFQVESCQILVPELLEGLHSWPLQPCQESVARMPCSILLAGSMSWSQYGNNKIDFFLFYSSTVTYPRILEGLLHLSRRI